MSDSVRVRFAPSPTGNVHIGNIRAAIFNYLFARHAGGQFLLRVEDTDLERSTPEAISALMDVLDWLDLNPDEDALFQSSRREDHLAAADSLIEAGLAYRYARTAEEQPAVFFRPPVDDEVYGSFLREVGVVEEPLHESASIRINHTGVTYATVSRKGKAVEMLSCLAGLKNLEVLDAIKAAARHGGTEALDAGSIQSAEKASA